MQKKSLSTSMAKLVMVVSLIVGVGSTAGVLGYYLIKQTFNIPPIITLPSKTISAIEISSDAKSILNAETKKVIFTIDDANKYLKDSKYAYNPDIFQTTKAKYRGDCFLDAVLSNNSYKIVFSTTCLPEGDTSPQTWVGIYNINWGSDPNTNCVNRNCLGIPKFRFLIAGPGKNFVWSQDDKTITYEADLGMWGMTETRTIDAGTGEVVENNPNKIECEPEKEYTFSYENDIDLVEMPCFDCPSGYFFKTIYEKISASRHKTEIKKCVKPIKDFKYYDISELNTENFEVGNYNTSGYLIWKSVCSGITRAERSSCAIMPQEIIISEDNQVITSEAEPKLDNNQIKIMDLFENPGYDEMKMGSKYRFSLILDEVDKIKIFKGVGFEEIKKIEDETADWKTYRNEEYGYEFKYPEDFYLEEPEIIGSGMEYTDTKPFHSIDLHSAISELNNQGWDSVFILTTVHHNGFELLPLVIDLTTAEEGGEIDKALEKAYAGEKGIATYKKTDNREEYGKIGGGMLFYYTLLKGDKFNYSIGIHLPYLIRENSTDIEIRKFINYYNQILSTFKFTETE